MAEAYLGKKVKRAVLTVPLVFFMQARRAMLHAAKIAGLDVVQLLNETTAAAIAYQVQNKISDGKKRNVVFVEYGSDGLLVSLLDINKNTVVITKCNRYWTGGDDFTHSLVKCYVKEFKRFNNGQDLTKNPYAAQRLRMACEQAKCCLSTENVVTVELDNLVDGISFKTAITRDDFEDICHDIIVMLMVQVNDMQVFVEESGIDVHDVVLFGGSTRIPKVQHFLSDIFGGRGKMNMSLDPDETFVSGAAALAFILSGGKGVETDGLTAHYATMWAFGVQHAKDDSKVKMVFDNYSPLPVEKSIMYRNLCKRGLGNVAYVIEGWNSLKVCCTQSSTVDLLSLPLKAGSLWSIEIVFSVDVNGILTVYAREKGTVKRFPLTIKHALNLDKIELERVTEEVSRHAKILKKREEEEEEEQARIQVLLRKTIMT